MLRKGLNKIMNTYPYKPRRIEAFNIQDRSTTIITTSREMRDRGFEPKSVAKVLKGVLKTHKGHTFRDLDK
jgi:hypothetical protein